MTQYLLADFGGPREHRLETILPILEFAVGSCGLSRQQALIELGFPEDKLEGMIFDRVAENLVNDPRVEGVILETLIGSLVEGKGK